MQVSLVAGILVDLFQRSLMGFRQFRLFLLLLRRRGCSQAYLWLPGLIGQVNRSKDDADEDRFNSNVDLVMKH